MSGRPRVFLVVAARPNFMKAAPILAEIAHRQSLDAVLVHTGQHYDANLSEVFFRDLDMPEPEVHLNIGSGTHAEQTGKLMIAFERLCLEDRPDLVLVVGDVNATVASALVAAKLHIPVAHVEAGLRSGDRSMPEEINRIVTDQLADLLFTTCRDADGNLAAEGVAREKIHFVGNVMVDSLLANLERADPGAAAAKVWGTDSAPASFGVLTMHRPSNVDEFARLEGWVDAFERISGDLPLACPLHPRTAKQLQAFGLDERFARAVRVTPPLGYLDFVGLVRGARLVITDSGGLQEETTVLGVPCLTIRDSTERPVTISEGSNRLVGTDPAALVMGVGDAFSANASPRPRCPELWDGRASERIVQVLERAFGL